MILIDYLFDLLFVTASLCFIWSGGGEEWGEGTDDVTRRFDVINPFDVTRPSDETKPFDMTKSFDVTNPSNTTRPFNSTIQNTMIIHLNTTI